MISIPPNRTQELSGSLIGPEEKRDEEKKGEAKEKD
jgi:hypothetical protein